MRGKKGSGKKIKKMAIGEERKPNFNRHDWRMNDLAAAEAVHERERELREQGKLYRIKADGFVVEGNKEGLQRWIDAYGLDPATAELVD